jgi:hypothetical protein
MAALGSNDNLYDSLRAEIEQGDLTPAEVETAIEVRW